MLDVLKANSGDAEIGIIDDSIVDSPEFNIVPARAIEGTSYKTKIRTGNPTVSFRKANDGVTASKSNLELRDVECYIMSARIQADKAVADVYPMGGAEAYFAEEAMHTFEASTELFGTQFYYGDILTSNGFPGLQSAVDTTMVYDATGTTAATATSIYLVRMGPRDVQAVLGANGQLRLGDMREETITGNNSLDLPGYVADLTAWIGLQSTNKNSIARIYNVTEDSGKTADDALIARGLELFPASRQPTHIFMNKRSIWQLQRSRTATTTDGREAPLPTSVFGIPIVNTDSLVITEAIDQGI